MACSWHLNSNKDCTCTWQQTFYQGVLTVRKQTKGQFKCNITSTQAVTQVSTSNLTPNQYYYGSLKLDQWLHKVSEQQQRNSKLHVSCLLLQRMRSLSSISECRSFSQLPPEDSGNHDICQVILSPSLPSVLSPPPPPSGTNLENISPIST